MLTDRIMRIGLGRQGGGLHYNMLCVIPGLRIIRKRTHGMYKEYVKVCRDLGIPLPPGFVFIRNPWQWYVSQWCWIRHVQRRQFPFQGTFREAMEITKKDNAFWYLRTLTWSWQRHGSGNAQYVGRFENLEDETVRIFLAIIPDLITEEEIRAWVKRDWEGRCRCPNGEYEDRSLEYRKYYDDELRQWVAEWDAGLIKKFGYEF